MTNNELMHYGILGMKWGVRRYQNPDGTLTAEGKKHYAKVDTAFKAGKEGKASKAEKVAKSSQDIVKDTGKITKEIESIKRSKNKEAYEALSTMSDDELRQIINRMELENRYSNLQTSKIDEGKIYASDILDIAGDVAAVAASAVSIAAVLYQIKKG